MLKIKRGGKMYLRTTKAKGKTYLNIVKSYRDGKKTRQVNVAALGCLDKFQGTDQLEKIARAMLVFCENKKNVFDITGAHEESRKIWGYVRVVRKLWEMFDFDNIFRKVIRDKKVEFDFFSAVFLMLLDRLREPKSKLGSFNEQDNYYGIKENELHHLYRALDILSEGKDEIEIYIFEKNKTVFDMRVDVCLYDVTTLFFESVRKDELKGFGFSKECKINEVQIVLGLLVDLDGRPIGFEIFPGNKYEGHTVGVILEKLKNKFKINRLIFVGDQAICTSDNLDLIEGKGFKYVVGSKIKMKTKELKEEILNIKNYITISGLDSDDILKYKQIDLEGSKIILTWSSKRAEKDKKDRERLIEKAKKLAVNRSLVFSKKGAMKYINIKQGGEVYLNEGKILDDARYDGFYGIQTNCKEFDIKYLLTIYHDLWKIEESFRIFKTHLETRPIFHWTPRRIKGHMVLCFIAFLLERTLEIELKKRNIGYSPIKIRKALDELQFSEIKIEAKTFYLRSKVEGLANSILRALRIKIPPAISEPANF